MSSRSNLLEGNILSKLVWLAIPIMGTSFLQMAYNLVDMLWIGRLGSGAVAAVGTAGFYSWFSLALVRLVQTGTEVNIAQSIGRGNKDQAGGFAATSLWMAVAAALAFTAFLLVFSTPLITFFGMKDPVVEQQGMTYLRIIGAGMIFTFINPIISCLYNGAGKSTIPFKANAVGLVANIILDPIFIFTFGLGVAGAAIATVLAQVMVTVVLIYLLIADKPFEGFRGIKGPEWQDVHQITTIGGPVAIQSGLFTIFGILIAKVIASFGSDAIAAQKVGVQIEAISYMTANGFAAAVSAFTGQNYGAGNKQRVIDGVKTAFMLMGGFGVFTSVLLFAFAEPLFKIFISEGPAVPIGVSYLQILGLSQFFMCVEITLSGFYNGLGKTKPPAIMSVIFTGSRVPLAYLLSMPFLLGLAGVWWTITATSIVKGLLMIWMSYRLIQRYKKEERLS